VRFQLKCDGRDTSTSDERSVHQRASAHLSRTHYQKSALAPLASSRDDAWCRGLAFASTRIQSRKNTPTWFAFEEREANRVFHRHLVYVARRSRRKDAGTRQRQAPYVPATSLKLRQKKDRGEDLPPWKRRTQRSDSSPPRITRVCACAPPFSPCRPQAVQIFSTSAEFAKAEAKPRHAFDLASLFTAWPAHSGG
jgi:hypothetical protein